ncbi:ribonuclease D [Trichloromonas sp.]|uniref:ribonuclease D n=1 Tax=Trichloromonas sp. TaxID=3069249 RepID=UPI003D8150EF
MPDTPILTDSAAVARFAEELALETVIAVDLEADSMHCYREKVCLLQFTTSARTVLIDPLSGADLSVLKPVMADASVRKLFHAADYDIRCLARDFGFEVRGLFDTMIACQFLGEEKVGLADVLGKYYGVQLDKQFQRADWAQRPLSGEMIRYAAEDTRHLHRLVELLEPRLQEKGRRQWVAEEFALLEEARFTEHEGPLFLRTKGAGTLDRRQLAILEELLQWREGEAQRRVCASFKVFGGKGLIEIARHAPVSLKGLVAIEGVFPRLVDRYGKKILAAVQVAMELPADRLPVYPRTPRPEKDPAADKRLLFLKEWRKGKAEALEIDPGLLINNALLETLSRQVPQTLAQLAEVAGLKNWQRQVLGEEILNVLKSSQ